MIDKNIGVSILSLTNEWVNTYRARITGSGQCLQAGHRIAETLKKYCDQVVEEPFILHPGSLWNIGRIMAVSFLLSAIMLFAGGNFIFVSFTICLVGLTYGMVHYIFYGDLFDRCFAKAVGCNVSGIIEPQEVARRQIFIIAHHDSSYVFSFLLRFQKLASIRLILAILSYLFLTTLSIIFTFNQLLSPGSIKLTGLTLIFVAIGLFFTLPLYFLITRIPSPGAGDNLSASVIAIKVAEYFHSRKLIKPPLKHTRLVFLSTDGEEVGQRGAIAYAAKHRKELLEIPTLILNIDSVYRKEDLSLLTRDRNGTMALSHEMVLELKNIGRDLGFDIKELALPFGGGGTDAAAFAKIGVNSTTLIGISASFINSDIVYHTPNDTVDHIQPAAVEAAFNLAVNYILGKDNPD
jgi:aminopeptidase YwaD